MTSQCAGTAGMPSSEVLADRSRAFEAFRVSYSGNPVIDANKAQLKAKYEEAKMRGQQVRSSCHAPFLQLYFTSGRRRMSHD